MHIARTVVAIAFAAAMSVGPVMAGDRNGELFHACFSQILPSYLDRSPHVEFIRQKLQLSRAEDSVFRAWITHIASDGETNGSAMQLSFPPQIQARVSLAERIALCMMMRHGVAILLENLNTYLRTCNINDREKAKQVLIDCVGASALVRVDEEVVKNFDQRKFVDIATAETKVDLLNLAGYSDLCDLILERCPDAALLLLPRRPLDTTSFRIWRQNRWTAVNDLLAHVVQTYVTTKDASARMNARAELLNLVGGDAVTQFDYSRMLELRRQGSKN